MELLLNIPVPVLVAVLAGAFFLHRAWTHSLLGTKTKLPTENTTSYPSARQPVKAESQATEGVSKESDFPADWWTGKGVYELERRAVFSKTWLPVLHRAYFTKLGDYHSLEIAGFPIFLILGKDGAVRAFHNVCRHRAYTVTRRETGSSTVLGCRYHGWSYNTYGQLVKAPQFDNVPGFEKAQNGLFEIHTRVSGSGFVFVNLDAGREGEIEDWNGDGDGFATRNGFGGNVSLVGGEVLEGEFNWKLGWMLGRVLDQTGLEERMSRLGNGSLTAKLARYFRRQHPEDAAVFPNASFHTTADTNLCYSLSFLPVSEQKTLIRYDLFCTGASHAPGMSETLKDFLNEGIRSLEQEYQTYINREQSTMKTLESASGDIQKQILERLKAHTKLEKTSGSEVFPAMRQPRPSQRFDMAEKLCRDLDCQNNQLGNGEAGNNLAW